MLRRQGFLLIVIGLLSPKIAHGWTITGSANDDTIAIGCIKGTNALYTCYNNALYFIESSTSSCALQSHGTVNAGSGEDEIDILYQGATFSCGGTSYVWAPPTNNGLYSINVNGGNGDDDIMGGNVRGTFHGNDGSDRITVLYSSGIAYGDGSGGAEGDWVDTWFNGDHEDLYGGTGDDCLEDNNQTADVFDCGDDGYNGDQYVGDPTPNDNCEEQNIFCFWP